MKTELSVLLDTTREKNNGTYPLKLRVYYNKKTRYYALIYELTEIDFGKIKAKRTIESISEIRDNIREVELKARLLAKQISPFSFDIFHERFIVGHPLFVQRKRIAKPVAVSTIDDIPNEWKKRFPIFNEAPAGPTHASTVYLGIMRSLLFQGRVSTAASYHSSYTSLLRFRGNVRLIEITARFLKEYESWMINDLGNSKTTVGINARCFRAVINEAIELKLMSRDDYPFGRRRYKIPAGKNIKKALGKESIAKLYYTHADTEHQQKAKDFWFFSFYGNGMNVKDIIFLKYKDIQGEYLVFERAKTELTSRRSEPIIISCFINDDMRKTISVYGNEDKSPDNFIFPVLTKGLSPIRQDEVKRNFISFINNNMAKICVKAGIEKAVGTMETRHSSATIMKNAGVSPHYIKESLGHTSLQTTENYLAGFQNEQKKEFAKILEGFKNA